MQLNIGLIGDYCPDVAAHQAIPLALQNAAKALDVQLRLSWLATDQIDMQTDLSQWNGFWCVPASPYRSDAGALRAIRYAREQGKPFLGTCGGFQYALLEYARNALGWRDAEHAETTPDAGRSLIAPLSCALVEVRAAVHLSAMSKIASAYVTEVIEEGYRCRYGLNPEYAVQLLAGPLQAVAWDEAGEVRAIELTGHPFFVATLFQPERTALQGQPVPLAQAFLTSCIPSS